MEPNHSGTGPKPAEPIPTVLACWDARAQVWVATSEDVPGLVAEAATEDALETKLKSLILELMAANTVPLHSTRFRLAFIRDVPLFVKGSATYEPDDGPLSDAYLRALRADVKKHFPRGALISSKDLFS